MADNQNTTPPPAGDVDPLKLATWLRHLVAAGGSRLSLSTATAMHDAAAALERLAVRLDTSLERECMKDRAIDAALKERDEAREDARLTRLEGMDMRIERDAERAARERAEAAITEFLAAEGAVEAEANRAEQPGANAWSSAPVVRRIHAVAALCAALQPQPQGGGDE